MGNNVNDLRDILKNLNGELMVNTTALQPQESLLCGEFCIYFIVHRLFNADLEFDEFLNTMFTEDVNHNEDKVKEFMTML